MYRTHNCGALRLKDIGKNVVLSGWVHRIREMGGVIFIDLRDRYGVTQLTYKEEEKSNLKSKLLDLGREFVIQVVGLVIERSNKNKHLPTGDIEITIEHIEILNSSEIPPFTIEDKTDGGEELRMKYRYLDIRRQTVLRKLQLRNKVALETRKFLDGQDFMDVETPYLIKSTPEGARDFVVPSRVHHGEFYALPQSPQTFKQLLMVSGIDRYYQIVRCFRDEDLRADRQPEFTQIDCEMSFVEQEDVLNTFEMLIKHLFKTCKNIELEEEFPIMTYMEAMMRFGSDKPDLRFGMEFKNLTAVVQNKGFKVFDDAELVIGIVVENGAGFTRKSLDELTNWVKRPQIGSKGLIYCKFNEDDTLKSSVDKFFTQADLRCWVEVTGATKGDLILVLSGKTDEVRKQMGALRLHLGTELGLRKPTDFKPVWIVDFPLLEWNEDENRFFAMHHPFTSPKEEDIQFLQTDPGKIRANAYDLAMNGVELGGGSIRIHDKELQKKMFEILGFTKEEAEKQFGFLMNALKFGAPPHGGIAFGLDRLVATLDGADSIRDYIAFPKNNAGRDTMIDAPATIDEVQLTELGLSFS